MPKLEVKNTAGVLQSGIYGKSTELLAAILLIAAFFPVQVSRIGIGISIVSLLIFLALQPHAKRGRQRFNELLAKSAVSKALIFGALLRLGLICLDDNMQVSDYGNFRNSALLLLKGGDWFNPSVPPGPVWFSAFFYWLTGESELSALMPNLALSVGFIALVSRFATRHFGHQVGVATAWITALNPELIIQANYVTSELGYAFFILFAAMLFQNARNKGATWLFIGILLGCAHYFRSTALLFLLCFVCLQWRETKSLRVGAISGALMCIGFLFAILPVLIHNRQNLGIYALSSYQMDGYSHFLSTNPNYWGNWNREDQLFFMAKIKEDPAPDGQHPAVHQNKLAYRLARARLDLHWETWLAAWLCYKPYNFWGDLNGMWWADHYAEQHKLPMVRGLSALSLFLWLKILLLCSGLCLPDALKKQPAFTRIFVVCGLAHTIMFCYFGTEGRYHNVFIAWLSIFAALLLCNKHSDSNRNGI